MSFLRVDRPSLPIILYRVSGAGAGSLWTADLDAAARVGSTWWAQVEPERLLVYCRERNEWLVDTRGLVVMNLDGDRENSHTIGKPAAGAARGPTTEARLAAYRTVLDEHRRRIEAAQSMWRGATILAST